MAIDGDHTRRPKVADMLPDEAATLPDRGAILDETDEEDLLTVVEAANELGIDID